VVVLLLHVVHVLAARQHHTRPALWVKPFRAHTPAVGGSSGGSSCQRSLDTLAACRRLLAIAAAGRGPALQQLLRCCE
jgi:hypothetical protein